MVWLARARADSPNSKRSLPPPTSQIGRRYLLHRAPRQAKDALPQRCGTREGVALQERKRGTGMAKVTMKDKEYEIDDALAEALVSGEGNARTRTISAKVSDVTYVGLVRVAARRGVTLSTLVNEAIEKEVGDGN